MSNLFNFFQTDNAQPSWITGAGKPPFNLDQYYIAHHYFNRTGQVNEIASYFTGGYNPTNIAAGQFTWDLTQEIKFHPRFYVKMGGEVNTSYKDLPFIDVGVYGGAYWAAKDLPIENSLTISGQIPGYLRDNFECKAVVSGGIEKNKGDFYFKDVIVSGSFSGSLNEKYLVDINQSGQISSGLNERYSYDCKISGSILKHPRDFIGMNFGMTSISLSITNGNGIIRANDSDETYMSFGLVGIGLKLN